MPPQPRTPRPENRGSLVIGNRPVDAVPSDPPPGYTPGAALAQTNDYVLTPDAARAAADAAEAAKANNGTPKKEQSDRPPGESAPVQDPPQEPQDDQDDAQLTYASENQVQAARLVLRAYARQRDGVATKAAAARAALAELAQMGGNRAQLAMVMADARVKPRELGLKADGSPAS